MTYVERNSLKCVKSSAAEICFIGVFINAPDIEVIFHNHKKTNTISISLRLKSKVPFYSLVKLLYAKVLEKVTEQVSSFDVTFLLENGIMNIEFRKPDIKDLLIVKRLKQSLNHHSANSGIAQGV